MKQEEETDKDGKKIGGVWKEVKQVQIKKSTLCPMPSQLKHNIVVFYKISKKSNEIQLTKTKSSWTIKNKKSLTLSETWWKTKNIW